MPDNQVTLKIDGVDVTIEAGKKIYDAAMKAGVYLPGLCYDPKITRFGGCRMCIVDVTARGRTRSKWACCEPVKDGIEVTTNSEKIRKKQRIMMEFLLSAHPLDCPVCNASGDCGLQDAAFFVGQKHGRIEAKRWDEPLVIDNPVLERDYNKCIMCGKCVVICDEVQGNGAIGFQSRGYKSEVGTPFRIPLECDYCGQCLHVCPTGSFLDHTEQYKGHAWEYEKTETICPYCAVGCTIVMNVKAGDVVKVTSNDYTGVNNGNLCARGRFGHGAIQAASRLKSAAVRNGQTLEPAETDNALDVAAQRLKEITEKHGPESVAVIASETMTNEDAYLLQKFFRAGLKSNQLDTLSNIRNNALNASMFDQFGSSAPICDYDEINKAGSFLFFGCDAEKENPVIANMIRSAMRDNHTPLFIANVRNTLFRPAERMSVNYKYGSETVLLSAIMDAVDNKDAGTAEATGLDSETIKDFAAAINKAGTPLILMGKEIHDHPMSVDIVKAVSKLAKQLGGKTLIYREHANSQGLNDMGVSSTHLPGYMEAGDPATSRHYSEKWGVDVPVFHKPDSNIFDRLEAGEIKGLLVMGCDPISQYIDGQFVRQAIQRAECLVVAGAYATATSELADVLVPTCVAAERDGTYTNNEGRIQHVRKSVGPAGAGLAEWQVINGLAKRMDIDIGSYNGCDEISQEIKETVPGYKVMTNKMSAKKGALVDYQRKGLQTRSLEFDTDAVKVASDNSYNTLALLGNSLYHLGVTSRQSETLNKIESRAYVEMNPDDASKAGLNEGDSARIESNQGTITASVRVTDKSPAGVVFLPINFENAPATHLVYRNDDVTMVKISRAE